MKKNIKFFIVLIIILIILVYGLLNKLKYNDYLDNTIYYKDKINYSTQIILNIKSKNTSSKIDYNVKKYQNIKKITFTNYINNEVSNDIVKYIINKKSKQEIYVYNGSTYEKQTSNEDFNIRYDLLKGRKLKRVSKNEYIVKMKSYQAYNLIYNKDIMTRKDLDGITKIKIKFDNNNKFIKEITYNIDNINKSNQKNQKLNYEVKIINYDINNQNKIELPFEN